MRKLENIKIKGFCITWKLIDLGYKGCDYFQNELSTREIIDYAISIMMDDENTDNIITDLACEYETQEDKVDRYVKQLAEKENTEYDLEYRKWRVLYVMQNLPNPEMEFINGLIELGDIWAKFDFPSDSPHVYQSRQNDMTPEQYYTQENFSKLLSKHKEWIDSEVNHILTRM